MCKNLQKHAKWRKPCKMSDLSGNKRDGIIFDLRDWGANNFEQKVMEAMKEGRSQSRTEGFR
jgi:hypothetical protein